MTVPSDSIVETLNVIKHVRLGILPCGIDAPFDSLLLQAAEESFKSLSLNHDLIVKTSQNLGA